MALVGHHGAGKTTLAEALLAATGAIARQGSVERGHDGLRLRARGDLAPARRSRWPSPPSTVDGVKVNVLDAPATPTSPADLSRPLAVADLAVVVVSATDGVQAQTEDAWRAAAAARPPPGDRVNKLDRERADFDRVLAEVRAVFGAGVAPVELPIGAERDFRGVIDLLDDSATLYATSSSGGPPYRRRGTDPRRPGRRPSTRSTSSWWRASSSATTT